VTVSDSSGVGGGGGGGGVDAGTSLGKNRRINAACCSGSSPDSVGAFRSGPYPNVRYMKSSDFCNADLLVKWKNDFTAGVPSYLSLIS